MEMSMSAEVPISFSPAKKIFILGVTIITQPHILLCNLLAMKIKSSKDLGPGKFTLNR